jgi:microsomal dipeptidase-like Zn-dependent dipeptidase
MRAVFVFALLFSGAVLAVERDLTVELHAHLFMKEGLGLMFTGRFEDELCAQDWTSRFSSQANPKSLRDSRNAITVMTLYAHPILKPDLHASIRAQIRATEQFVAANPDFALARSPQEARRALEQGKRVLVLGLETAAGIIDTDESFREFIDEAGVRIVTLLHLTDDALGGGAFLKGITVLANPWAFFQQLWSATRDEFGNRLNPRGITGEGLALLRKLMERRVWVDFSHATDAAQSEMFPLLKEFRQPLLYTHTALRPHHAAERGLHPEHLKQVAQTQGMIGLMPSEDMLAGTAIPPELCPSGCLCDGGVFALATHYRDAAQVIGAESVVLGSDFNGGIRHIPPPGCSFGASGLGPEGFFHMGQTPALWQGLRAVGAPVPTDLSVTVEAFLQKWEQVMGAGP